MSRGPRELPDRPTRIVQRITRGAGIAVLLVACSGVLLVSGILPWSTEDVRAEVLQFLGRSEELPRSGKALGGIQPTVKAADAMLTESFYASHVQPIFDRSCVTCHGEKKTKGGLQLHTFAALVRGGKNGPVVVAGDPAQSELHLRITLPSHDVDVMPPDGKKLLSARQVAVIAAWIEAGASLEAKPLIPDESPAASEQAPIAAAPDYRAFASQLAAIEQALPVRLVPVSQTPTDGLILRTASAPQKVDDAVLAKLAPVAMLIVDAELARTNITDAALAALGGFGNLQRLDLAHTRITSGGLAHLGSLTKLHSLNLVATKVDDSGRTQLQRLPALQRIHTFGTAMSAP